MPDAPLPLGFVTYDGASHLTDDDRLVIEPLHRLGIAIEPVVWDDPSVTWNRYSAHVLRSTWDYHKKAGDFSRWLERIERSGCPLWNPPALIRWNMEKQYLRDLAEAGIPGPPTVWLERGERCNLPGLLESRGWRRAVVKPVLSATAYLTWVTSPDSALSDQARLDEMVERGGVLVQRFEEAIAQGEWSLIYFAGRYSHAVLKRPSNGDFRVQKEYGGTSEPRPAPRRVEIMAERVLKEVGFPWLYARVDLVDAPEGVRLMELEMLEPDLFLRHHPEAPQRFAEAISARLAI